MDYNKLIDQCHSAAKKNGWWDEPRPHEEIVLLIKSELFEAMDAYRIDKRVLLPLLEYIKVIREKDFKQQFKINIKDTFEDEIADTAIRIFDYLGWLEYETPAQPCIPDLDTLEQGFMETLQILDIELSSMYDEMNLNFKLPDVLNTLFLLSKAYNFDLHTHIQLKLRYNATRGKKHGKKF